MAKKTYRPWAPDQAYLFPPSPRDWLPEGHLAYFIMEVVSELDLSAILEVIERKDPRGEKAYHPRMMVALLLYGYSVGLFSSRKIADATYTDVAVRYISGEQHPHFTRIAAFRRDHLEALAGLFVQVVNLCAELGLVDLGHISIDGTKVRANASKHKAMSYDRMKAEEARLSEEIDELLAKAEAADSSEDALYGEEQDGSVLPDELKRREKRLARIREAMAGLEKEARTTRASHLRELAENNDEREADSELPQSQRRAAATRAKKQRAQAEELVAVDEPKSDQSDDDDSNGEDDGPPSQGQGLPTHRVPAETDGTPKPSSQRNFTDPDSRIMVEGSGAYAQAYNAQAAVAEGSQVIVAAVLSNQAPDVEYLVPTLREVEAVTGELPKVLTADTGYYSASNTDWCESRGIVPYIATGRMSHGPSPPETEPSPSAKTPKEKMAERVKSPEGREMYRRRKYIVEPVFGQIKEARGFRRFLLRGLEKARGEWSLLCLTHNLLKAFRARRNAMEPAI